MGGRYEMLERVGVGAMGLVYRARQRSIDKEVAVKVLHTHIGAQENLRKRFAQEARVGSRFQHPGSVEVLDFGVHFDGTVFLVMEYLRGRSLDALIRAEAPLATHVVVEVMDQVLSAVAAAHDAGIVHRDLKPENVMLLPGDDAAWRVKVADFGLAKLLDDTFDSAERAKLTATGMFHGTPGFIAPEQAQARAVDGRADLYSCGVMIFEMCTGRLPFTADTAMGMVLQHITEAPPPMSRFRPDVDPRLDALVLRAMQKRPEDRFADARAMRAALRSLHDGVAHRPSVLPTITGSGPELAITGSAPDAWVTEPAVTEPAPAPAVTEPAPAVTAPAPAPHAASVAASAPTAASSSARAWSVVGLAAATSLVVATVTMRGASTTSPPPPSRVAPITAPLVAATSATPSEPVAPPSPPRAPAPPPPVAPPTPFAAPSIAIARAGRPSTRVLRETSPSLAAPSLTPSQPPVAPVAPSVPPPVAPPAAAAVAAPPVAPPVTAPVALPVAPPSLVRAVRGGVGAVRVSGGVARTAVSSRVSQAAESLARCVEQRVRGTDGLREPATVTVEVSVRDRRLDAMTSRGAPAGDCDAPMRAAFAGDLPPSEDLEYAITFQVELTAVR